MKTRVYTLLLLLISLSGWSQDEWIQTNGPSGGEVYTISASPNGYLYAGTRIGLYRSSDNGDNWSLINFPLAYAYTAVNSNGDVFAASGNIYRSTDDGITWDSVTTAPGFFTNMVIDPAGTIYAGNVSWEFGNSILISYDNGDTWQQQFVSTGIVDRMLIGVNSLGYIFIGTDNSLYRSTDNGVTLEPIGEGYYNVRSILVTPDDDLFVGVDFGEGVHRSTDNGNTLVQVLAGHDVTSLAAFSDSLVFAGTESGVYRSADNGDTWEAAGNGLPETDIISLAFDFDDNLYAGAYGIFRSDDFGDTWTGAYTGIAANRVLSLGSNNDGDLFALADGVYRTTDNGSTWTRVNEDIRATVYQSLLVHTNGDIYVPDDLSDGLFRSRDNGETWQELFNNAYSFVPHAVAVNAGGDIYVAGNSGVLRSTDDGASWSRADNGLVMTQFSSIAINDSGYIFVASDQSDTLYRSVDDGNSWSPVLNVEPPASIATISINGANTIFAGTFSSTTYRSMDHGNTWEPLIIPFTVEHPVVWDIDFDENNTIYIATYEEGVFESTDNGNTWQQANEGLTFLSLYSIHYSATGFLFAGTNGASVWRRDIDVSSKYPASAAGSPLIYPNPAGSVINYQNTVPGARYRLINEYGQVVRSGTFGPGLNTIDIERLSKGIYLLRIESEGRVVVKI